MKTIKKTITTYFNDGFFLSLEPFDDSIRVKKLKGGSYRVGYLSVDDGAESPEEYGDGSVMLYHSHRQFENVPTGWSKERILNALNKDDENGDENGGDDDRDNFYFFPVTSYIHSGVVLRLDDDSKGWDVSRCGFVIVKKSEFDTEIKAKESALNLIKSWNDYLSGEVYTIVFEHYDENKVSIDDLQSCGGYYGYDYALKELEAEL